MISTCKQFLTVIFKHLATTLSIGFIFTKVSFRRINLFSIVAFPPEAGGIDHFLFTSVTA